MLIVWFQNGWDDQYVEAGGPGSPNFHKSNALKTMRQRPELRARCWRKAAGIISWWMSWYRKPAISYCRNRATAAFQYPLDSLLRSRGIRHLVFTGIATNVCVESTLRDGFFLEYFGVVLEDATHQAGPDFAQKAALFNIETFLAGSVTSMISATRWIPARPYRLRRTAMPKSVIIPPGTSTPIAPSFPARSPTAWCMSRARCHLIKTTTWCLSTTQGANPPRAGDDQNRDRNGGWYDGGRDLQQHLYHRLEKLRRD